MPNLSVWRAMCAVYNPVPQATGAERGGPCTARALFSAREPLQSTLLVLGSGRDVPQALPFGFSVLHLPWHSQAAPLRDYCQHEFFSVGSFC